ncbi:MAG TPA: FAD-dependent monooxygenase, partial [Acidimicrobiales bacterium]|nr:FAD-dependent monooxygenase [Acidimicrobiales bacterium]
AGPAGVSTAVGLVERGWRVTVVDRARFPRDKCCGDGLTTGALRGLSRLGLDPADVASWTPVADVALRSPSGRLVPLSLPSGGTFAAVARRADLDAALVELARRRGVEVLEGRRVLGASAGADGPVTLSTAEGDISAPFVVAADGAWSVLRKELAPADGDGYLGEWHAMRQYMTGVSSEASNRLWVWFEPELLPGYAWSFPVAGGLANFGLGVLRRPGVRTGALAELWRRLLDRPHIHRVLGPGAEPEAPLRAWPIPARVERTSLTAAGGRVLFVGDAARAADPMTGEGIGQAIDTGEAAADAIAAARGRPDLAARLYEAAVGSTLAVDNRLAALLSRGLSHRKGVRAAVAVAGASDWTRRNFARWMFESYPRAVLATPWRWRRGMLAGPAPYP